MLSLKANWEALQEAKKEIDNFIDNANADVLVGFKSGQQHTIKQKNGEDKSIDMSELARKLTFGAHGIPERPFLQEGILSKKKELQKEIETQWSNIRQKKKANWNKLGTKAVAAVQEFVRGDYYKTHAPNSPATIREKGSNTPLIDTGEMINSLVYVVEGGDK